MPKDKTITDSLTGVLSDSKLDESDYKKHLEEKHIQSDNELKESLEAKLKVGVSSGISKRSMDEIFDAAMLRRSAEEKSQNGDWSFSKKQ